MLFRPGAATSAASSNVFPYRSVSSTDSTTAADFTVVLSGASFTLTLHTAVGNDGQVMEIIHDGTSFTQAYTINTTSGQTVGGFASGALVYHSNGQRGLYQSNGVVWKCLLSQAVTPWVNTGALSLSATGTSLVKGAITTDILWARRNGKQLEMRGEYIQSGAGTAGTGAYILLLPNSLTIDTAYISASTGVTIGVGAGMVGGCGGGYLQGPAGTALAFTPMVYDTTHLKFFGVSTSNGNGALWGGTTPGLLSTTVGCAFHASVPITGWDL